MVTASGSDRAWFDEHGRYWAYLYLLRVPALTLLILLVLAPLSVGPTAPAGPLLRGLFDLAPPQHVPPEGPAVEFLRVAMAFGLVTLLALLAAAAVAVTAGLVLRDGAARFGARPVPERPGINLALRLLPLAGALSIVLGAWAQTWPAGAAWPPRGRLLGMLAGTLAGGAAFGALVRVGQAYLWAALEESGGWRDRGRRDWPARIVRALIDGLTWLARWSPQGYLDGGRELWSRHVFAVFQTVISLAIYGALWAFKWGRPAEAPLVPPLCLALTLVVLSCWLLAALAFFFDRFRIPVLLVLVVLFSVVGLSPRADSFYKVTPRAPASWAPNCPREQLWGLPSGAAPDTPVVVVAATGGGIQAAAWAARVLAGLHQGTQGEARRFDEAVRLISSVSGGSAGALHLVHAYRGGRLPSLARDEAALDAYGPLLDAEASSLDEVGWGLAYPDFVFSLVPILRLGGLLTVDRGSALEGAWRQRLERRAGPGEGPPTLGGWRGDARRGHRPAVIFNATLVESGQRLLVATTDLEPVDREKPECGDDGRDPAGVGRRDFRALYPGSEIEAATGARLSATFPYVSPATRILRDGHLRRPEYHVVDGGYYDNYGVATLVEWLERALEAPAGPAARPVIVVEIRSSAVGGVRAPDGSRGWIFQAIHPLTTMLSVRGAGQLSHNELDARLVQALARLGHQVPLWRVIFEFPATDARGVDVRPPLSWHLTPADKAQLRAAWASQGMAACRDRVRDLLREGARARSAEGAWARPGMLRCPAS